MKTDGFLGVFDILGYGKLNENNDLDTLVDIFDKYILGIDDIAISLGGIDFSLSDVKTEIFSDTIFLYEADHPTNLIRQGIIDPSLFLLKACILLRLAFEGGIPLRGAVSYGRYYIHESRMILGSPIIDAHNLETCQDWSGAVLCDSAEKEYNARLDHFRKIESPTYGGINPIEIYNFIAMNSLCAYVVPYKIPSNKASLALCWDDSLLCSLGLHEKLRSIERLNYEKIDDVYKRVEEKFRAHNKPVEGGVSQKINNTAQFIIETKGRRIEY